MLVTARRLKDSGISAPEPLPEITPIEHTARPLGAPELVGLFDDEPAEAEVEPDDLPLTRGASSSEDSELSGIPRPAGKA